MLARVNAKQLPWPRLDLLCWSIQKECVCMGTVSHITAALPCCCHHDENDERYMADTAVRHAGKETQHACRP
jgi:hypothetical protein